MSNDHAGLNTDSLPDKTVTLSLNEQGYAVPDQDPVTAQRNQQKIKWCAPFEFQIQIDGYDDIKYKTGSGSCAYEAKSGVFSGKRYKYSIVANGKTNDPDIVIEP